MHIPNGNGTLLKIVTNTIMIMLVIMISLCCIVLES